MVPEYQLGTAYGMMQSIQNLGLALVSIASGTIVGKVLISFDIKILYSLQDM